MMLASDDSDASGSSGIMAKVALVKVAPVVKMAPLKVTLVGGKGNSRSHGESDSRGTDGALTSGTGSIGSHSRLEGPRELDSEEVGESTVLPTSSSKVESGEESA